MPASVYKEKIAPIQPALSWIFSAFDDSEITSADQVGGFYAQRLHNIENQLADKYANAPQAKQAALALNSRVETPFNYAYGYGDTSPDIIVLLLLVRGLFCTAMAAPVFAADYHSRADDIQRCTRYGRGKLSAARSLAVLILVLAIAFILPSDRLCGLGYRPHERGRYDAYDFFCRYSHPAGHSFLQPVCVLPVQIAHNSAHRQLLRHPPACFSGVRGH